MPTVSVPTMREMARKQRVVGRRDPDRDDHEGREHGLRDEELGHALDVPEDPPPLGDHARDRREVAVDEHDVGDGLRHLGARALRDREVRRLQRGHVVDAVTHHRHVAPALGGATRRRDACLPARSVRPPTSDVTTRSSSASAAGSVVAVERRPALPECRRRSRSSRRFGQHRPRARRSRLPCSTRYATVSLVSRRSSSASTARPSVRSERRAVVRIVRKVSDRDPEADDPPTRPPGGPPTAPASSPSGKSSGAPST